jgi:hypothetical protein
MICNRWSFADRLQIRQLQARLACTSENVEQELFTHPIWPQLPLIARASQHLHICALQKPKRSPIPGIPFSRTRPGAAYSKFLRRTLRPTRNSNRKAAPEL